MSPHFSEPESRRKKPGDEARVRHMLDATRRAMQLAESKDVAALDPDSETALALTRLLEILGEAAARVTPELRAKHPEIPWRDIAGTRNRVIHEYFDVDLEIVAAIVREDLPPLVGRLQTVLGGITETGENQ